jgi:DNA helicase-2/ATP-dependent DNA helicase PcrA
MTSDLLNPRQQEAVEHVEGPLLVLAGAGSGKTRIVTFRIMRLLQLGVPAGEILAVTFTNKAAEEMRSRVFRLAGQTVLTCTFHSLCARILRESITPLGYPHNFAIYDEDDSERVLKECLAALNVKLEKGEFKTLRGQISQAKNALLEPEHFRTEDPVLFQSYDLYQKKLQSYHALDFDDLLFLTAKLLKEHPDILALYQKRWAFILIDEYQDTNAAQYTIVKLLAKEHGNVFAVGDPDQSIYSWRGANVQNILQFSQDFPGAKVIPLEQNYRSRSNILEAANALIQHNANRLEKNLWSDRGEGEKIGLYRGKSDRDEVEFIIQQMRRLNRDIPLSDMVIFYRTNFQSRIFEDRFLRDQIPYTIVGGLSFYQRKEIKDILSWLKVTQTGRDAIAFARTINLPKRGIGESTLTRLQEHADQRGIGVVDLCEEIAQAPIKLSQKQLFGLQEYMKIVDALRQMVKAKLPLHEIISEVIERSRYLDILKEDPDTYEERRANLAELVTKASEWEAETPNPSLTQFLEELTLKSSVEEGAAPQESIRMMTLHNGKGLEFSVVFLVGMEEELFPHVNTLDSSEALEEERRLCYVGMTRAKEVLFLTCSSYRYLWGMPRTMRPSRFLREIPSELLHPYHTAEESHPTDDELSDGDAVLHRDFGRGLIQSCYQTSLGVTYDVFFPQEGRTRSLVARFAKLTRA